MEESITHLTSFQVSFRYTWILTQHKVGYTNRHSTMLTILITHMTSLYPSHQPPYHTVTAYVIKVIVNAFFTDMTTLLHLMVNVE